MVNSLSKFLKNPKTFHNLVAEKGDEKPIPELSGIISKLNVRGALFQQRYNEKFAKQ
jgi:hypothetical protein